MQVCSCICFHPSLQSGVIQNVISLNLKTLKCLMSFRVTDSISANIWKVMFRRELYLWREMSIFLLRKTVAFSWQFVGAIFLYSNVSLSNANKTLSEFLSLSSQSIFWLNFPFYLFIYLFILYIYLMKVYLNFTQLI